MQVTSEGFRRSAHAAFIAGLVVIYGLAAPRVSAGVSENAVRDIQVDLQGSERVVRIKTDQEPTFTVFRLENPMRVVVDISNGDVRPQQGAKTYEDGVLDRIGFRQFNAGGVLVGRVIVSFAAPVTYQVDTDGTNIVLRASTGVLEGLEQAPPPLAPMDRATSEAYQTAKREAHEAMNAAQVERRAAEGAARDAESKERIALTRAAEAERLSHEAKRAQQEAIRLRQEAEESVARDKRKAEKLAQEAQRRLERASKEASAAEQARTLAERRAFDALAAQRQAEEAAARAEVAHKTRVAELRAREAELTKEKAAVAKVRKSLEQAQHEAELAQAALSDAEARNQTARRELAEKIRQADARHREAEVRLESLESERLAIAQAKKDFAAEKAKLEKQKAEVALERRVLVKKQEEAVNAKVEAKKIARREAQVRADAAREVPLVQAKKTPQVTLASAGYLPAPASSSILKRVSSPNRDAVVLHLSGEPEFDVETVQDPPRLVIDIKNAKKGFAGDERRVVSDFAQRVRFGVHGRNLRAVLDLQRDVTPSVTRTGQGISVAWSPSKAVSIPTLAEVAFSGDRARAEVAVTLPDDVEVKLDDRSKKAHVLTMPGLLVPKRLERSLDTTAYGSVVDMVSTYQAQQEPPVAKVVAHLNGKARSQIVREGGRLKWSFRPAEAITVAQASSGAFVAPPRDQGIRVAQTSPGTTKRPKKRFSIDLKDADVVNVIRLIADISGQNIITSEEVRGKITLRLRNVPWDKALDTILKTKGYAKVKENNIIRIAPAEKIQLEKEQALARKKAQEQVEDTTTQLLPINYAVANEIITQLKPLLSGRGNLEVDARTNTLIVTDLPEHVQRLSSLAAQLDRQTPLVLIEARIVEASENFTHELGVQWGGTARATSRTGNPTGLAFPNDFSVSGGADDAAGTITTGSASPGRYAVNLPAPVGSGSGGALGFTFGSAGGTQLLNLRLSALEQNGSGRIISSPRVTTLDNTKAVISQGTDIPIQVVSAAGANTRFVQARLELEVTPHVTNDGSILMKIRAKKDEPNFAQTGAAGDPSISKRTAETEVLVYDGDTTVIGGIYTRRTTKSESAVPFFSKLPIIGWMFRSRQEVDERAELLIFITPKIINREKSLGSAARFNEPIPGFSGDG